MDANGLRVSDGFRMRSPVVWLCFVVVVLCALSAESSVRRGYHIIHGQAGPIIRSVIPVTGLRGVQPNIQGRRVQRQEDYDDEEEDEEEEEEEDFEGEYAGLTETGGGPGPVPGYPVGVGPEGYYEEEDEEEEEEEEEEDYGDERSLNEVHGRQAFINNQYIETPNTLRQSNNPNKRQQNGNNNNNNRAPVKNNNNRRQQNQGNQGNQGPNRGGNNGNRPANPNRRRPTAAPIVDRPNNAPNRNRQQVTQKTTPTPQLQPVITKQKLQLRPVASSTQFIATPVADLILRLSISLAKPVGHGNTTFNVPIRVHPAAGFNNVIQLDANKAEIESAKVDPVDSVAVNVVHKHEDLSEESEEADEDDKDQGADESVTELPRK